MARACALTTGPILLLSLVLSCLGGALAARPRPAAAAAPEGLSCATPQTYRLPLESYLQFVATDGTTVDLQKGIINHAPTVRIWENGVFKNEIVIDHAIDVHGVQVRLKLELVLETWFGEVRQVQKEVPVAEVCGGTAVQIVPSLPTSPGPPTGGGVLALTPNPLAFGDVALGEQSAPQTLTLRNAGTASLTIGDVTDGGPAPGDFRFIDSTCPSPTLTPGASCGVRFVFVPQGLGNRSVTVTFVSDATNSVQSVTFTGNGTGGAPVGGTLALTPNPLAFGNAAVGGQSAILTLALRNTGTAALTIGDIRVDGPNPGDFGVVDSTCVSLTLTPGASCGLRFVFAPQGFGGRYVLLTFISDAANGVQSVTLTGFGGGAGGGVLALTPNPLDFGAVIVGNQSPLRTLTVSNAGTAPLTISNIAVGGANPDDFGVTNDGTCTSPVLAPGASCVYRFAFVPRALGSRYVTITFTSDAGNAVQAVTLAGVGGAAPPPPGPSPSPIPATSWAGWSSQGGILTDAPAAAGFNGRVYVFAKGSDNALYEKHSADGATFTDWRSEGGVLTAAPAAASFTASGSGEALYLFARGTDGALYERHTGDGVVFTDWQSLGGQVAGPPAAAGVSGRLYAFVRWRDNALWERHTLP